MAQTKASRPGMSAVPCAAEEKYPLCAHREGCGRLYSVSHGTFDAATASLKGREYSVEKIKSHIQKWLKQEVKR